MSRSQIKNILTKRDVYTNTATYKDLGKNGYLQDGKWTKNAIEKAKILPEIDMIVDDEETLEAFNKKALSVELPQRVTPVRAPQKVSGSLTGEPVREPIKAPVKAPIKAPIKAPVKAPIKAPVKAPIRTQKDETSFKHLPSDVIRIQLMMIEPNKIHGVCTTNKQFSALCAKADFKIAYAKKYKNQLPPEGILELFNIKDEKYRQAAHDLGMTLIKQIPKRSRYGYLNKLISFDPNNTNTFDFGSAAQNGHKKIIELMFKKAEENGDDIKRILNDVIEEDDYPTILESAIAFGDLDFVKYLVEMGADINIANGGGISPVMVAAEFGYLDIVKYLVEHGANIEPDFEGGQSALLIAASGATPISWDYSPPIYPTSKSRAEVIKYLLSKGANLIIQDYDKRTFFDYLYLQEPEKTEIRKLASKLLSQK
jgi:ankyrin repeat protein